MTIVDGNCVSLRAVRDSQQACLLAVQTGFTSRVLKSLQLNRRQPEAVITALAVGQGSDLGAARWLPTGCGTMIGRDPANATTLLYQWSDDSLVAV